MIRCLAAFPFGALSPALCLALTAPLLSACAVAGDEAIPGLPPEAAHVACPHIPAPRTDPDPKPPVSAFPQIRTPGHWEWSGGHYEWHPASWQPKLGAAAPVWRPGHWSASGGACVWHPGYHQWRHGGA